MRRSGYVDRPRWEARLSKEVIKVIARNKRAKFDYELGDHFEAGLVLLGSEVKSLRSGRANIAEAYVRLRTGEAWLIHANIPEYPQAGQNNHEPTRPRKLLLKRSELKRLKRMHQEKGLTIVPLQLFFRGAWIKLELAVGRGKKRHDKRQNLKKKAHARDQRNAR